MFINISPRPDVVDSHFPGLFINFIKDAPATDLVAIRAGFSFKGSGIRIVQWMSFRYSMARSTPFEVFAGVYHMSSGRFCSGEPVTSFSPDVLIVHILASGKFFSPSLDRFALFFAGLHFSRSRDKLNVLQHSFQSVLRQLIESFLTSSLIFIFFSFP